MSMRTLEHFLSQGFYQFDYNYEERVDLFNRFGIPTSQKFFTPFFTYLNLHINKERLMSYGYSHAGAVSSHALRPEKWHMPNLEASAQSQLFGTLTANVIAVRNTKTQKINVVKGQVGVWEFRFNPNDFSFDFKLSKMALEVDKNNNPTSIDCNPTKALYFLKLTGYSHLLINAPYK